MVTILGLCNANISCAVEALYTVSLHPRQTVPWERPKPDTLPLYPDPNNLLVLKAISVQDSKIRQVLLGGAMFVV